MNQKYQQLNESHLNLLEELRSSTEEYETLKGEMAERSHTVQDTAPLAKIKDARNHGCLFDPRGGSEAGWLPNFRGFVLGCMDSYDSEQRRIFQQYFFRDLQDLHSFAPLQTQICSLSHKLFSRYIS